MLTFKLIFGFNLPSYKYYLRNTIPRTKNVNFIHCRNINLEIKAPCVFSYVASIQVLHTFPWMLYLDIFSFNANIICNTNVVIHICIFVFISLHCCHRHQHHPLSSSSSSSPTSQLLSAPPELNAKRKRAKADNYKVLTVYFYNFVELNLLYEYTYLNVQCMTAIVHIMTKFNKAGGRTDRQTHISILNYKCKLNNIINTNNFTANDDVCHPKQRDRRTDRQT